MSPGYLSFKIRLIPLTAADGRSSSSLNLMLSFVCFSFPTALYLPCGITHRPLSSHIIKEENSTHNYPILN